MYILVVIGCVVVWLAMMVKLESVLRREYLRRKAAKTDATTLRSLGLGGLLLVTSYSAAIAWTGWVVARLFSVDVSYLLLPIPVVAVALHWLMNRMQLRGEATTAFLVMVAPFVGLISQPVAMMNAALALGMGVVYLLFMKLKLLRLL
jgi:hypothetical protein